MNTETKIKTITVTLLTLSLLSCTGSVPRRDLQNLPSLVEIVAVNFNQQDLKIRVSHRNKTARVGNQLSCQLAIKDSKPLQFNEIPVPDLTTYAVETLDIKLPTGQQAFLRENNKELPYVLDCFLFSENFRKEHLIKKASLFLVPGTENTYR